MLSAEAGYGKTSLLLSVLPDLELPAAWLTLEETDSDVNLFSAGLVAAIRQVRTQLGDEALAALTAGPHLGALRQILLQALSQLPAMLLVLDDFHLVDGSPDVNRMLDDLLAALPPQVHLVIATRTWPKLQILPQLLVRGDAMVLDKSHLGFTAEETAVFFRRNHGLDADDADVARATERTEGWPAALQLVAMAASDRGALALQGTPKEIFDYLAATVVETLPGSTQEFLLHTSILGEFGPALCDAVTERTDAVSTLEDLERRNLFLYRLDEAGTRYRYHQLFAEFLQHRLQRRGLEYVARVQHKAGRWFEDQGIVAPAVRHYLLGHSYDDAVRLLAPHHSDRLTAKEAYLLREIVLQLPGTILDRYPWLLRSGASSARYVGDYSTGLRLARQAMESAKGSDLDLWAFSAYGAAVMHASMDQYEDAVAILDSALANPDPRIDPRTRSAILGLKAECYLQLGRIAEAVQVLDRIEQTTTSAADYRGRSFGMTVRLGQIARMRLQYTAAREYFTDALRLADASGSRTIQAWARTEIIPALVGLREGARTAAALTEAQQAHALAGERDTELKLGYLSGDAAFLSRDLPEAERHYQMTLAKCRAGESAEPRIWIMLGLAKVARARGHLSAARTLLDAAAALGEQAQLRKTLPDVWLEQIGLCRITGQPLAGRDLLARVRALYQDWDAEPGLAWCDFLVARLHWDIAGTAAPPDATLSALRAALQRTPGVAGDLLPRLREEAGWTADLLIQARLADIEPQTAENLLTALAAVAMEPLLEALQRFPAQVWIVHALGRTGDPRARRPLLHLQAHADAGMRTAIAAALTLLHEPDAPRLHIRMLGGFEVTREDTIVTEPDWKTQKVKGLLKYLVLHRGRRVHQEQIIELLWPDRDPAAGATSLKTAIKHLRLALEPLLEGTRSHFIHREGDTIRFSIAEPVWLDIDAYDRAVAEARRLESEGRLGDAVDAYERAVDLYRGDFLAEDLYADWTLIERERRRELQIAVLETLAAIYARRGDYPRAIDRTHRVLALDRLRESAYRRLMECYLAQGDRPGVVRTYRTCDQVLREELGISPQRETAALYERTQTGL